MRNSKGRKLVKNIDDITSIVVDTAFQLQYNLGPGLLKSVYEAVLEKVLKVRRLVVEHQKPVPAELAEIIIDEGAKETKKDLNYFLAV